jgi:hypothetical protein
MTTDAMPPTSYLSTMASSALGLLDSAYYLMRFKPGSRPLFFPGGFARVREAQEWATERIVGRLAGLEVKKDSGCPGASGRTAEKSGTQPAIVLSSFSKLDKPPPYSVLWTKTPGLSFYEGTFTSPAADLLKECPTVPFIFVAPETSDYAADLARRLENPHITPSSNSPPAVIVHLPATGEQTHALRLDIPCHLAQTHGWCSLVPIAPFYGTRAPPDQIRHMIRTLADLVAQSSGIMVEGAHLTTFAEQIWPKAVVGITGFSWGAAMASCSSLIASSMLSRMDNPKLACIPYIGSPSPSPFVDGILQNDIDWDALLADALKNGIDAVYDAENNLRPEVKPGEATKEIVRDRVSCVMANLDLKRFIAALEEGRAKVHAEGHPKAGDKFAHIDSLVCVSARDDKFVRPFYSQLLFEMLDAVTVEGNSENLWISGGHVAAFLWRPWVWVDAIERAVGRLLVKG